MVYDQLILGGELLGGSRVSGGMYVNLPFLPGLESNACSDPTFNVLSHRRKFNYDGGTIMSPIVMHFMRWLSSPFILVSLDWRPLANFLDGQ